MIERYDSLLSWGRIMGGMVQDGGLGYAFGSNRSGRRSVSILSVVVRKMKKLSENLPYARQIERTLPRMSTSMLSA